MGGGYCTLLDEISIHFMFVGKPGGSYSHMGTALKHGTNNAIKESESVAYSAH